MLQGYIIYKTTLYLILHINRTLKRLEKLEKETFSEIGLEELENCICSFVDWKSWKNICATED